MISEESEDENRKGTGMFPYRLEERDNGMETEPDPSEVLGGHEREI